MTMEEDEQGSLVYIYIYIHTYLHARGYLLSLLYTTAPEQVR